MKRALLLLWACLAAIPAVSAPIDIPAEFSRGRPIISAKLNGSGPYRFLLDTACTIPTLHPEVMDILSVQPRGTVRIHGIAGIERAPTFPNISFDLGGASYQPRRVASIPSERSESRRRRDGVIGSSFFERFVVIIDGPKQALQLHSPTNFVHDGPGEILPFRFHEEIPVIKGAIAYPGQPPIECELEVDTGCDSGLCLGDHFVKAHQLVERTEGRRDEKFGVGGSVETHNGSVPLLQFGQLKIEDAQADFFLEGSPVDEPLAGHLGMGVLSKYKVVFDYPRKRVIILP